jgi:hypothetical protein
MLPPVPVAMWASSQPAPGRRLSWGLVVLVTGAWLTLGSLGSDAAPAGTVASTTTSTEAAMPATPEPAPTSTLPTISPTTVAPGPPAQPTVPSSRSASAIDQLVVAPETTGEGYDWDLFPHWTDDDRDGCDVRCETLRSERRTDLPGLPGGGWLSTYDAYTTADETELEIDHVVALAEAWRSGASTWDAARRTAFANDLDPDTLIAVSAASNRSKSDRDPASWQPPNRESWCGYATSWSNVKVRWGLTADAAEVAALRNMLAAC